MSNQIQPEISPNLKILRRCRGSACGRRLHPIGDFMTPRDKLCLECRGLTRDATGVPVLLKPPRPPKRARKNAAPYPTQEYTGYKRYIRERQQRLRAEARAAAGKPPRQPPAHGTRCPHHPLGPDGKRPFLPRSKFTGLNTICDDCLAKELARIEHYQQSLRE